MDKINIQEYLDSLLDYYDMQLRFFSDERAILVGSEEHLRFIQTQKNIDECVRIVNLIWNSSIPKENEKYKIKP